MSLERALELAERGRGTTHPNPVVGAVIVADGEVVGEGELGFQARAQNEAWRTWITQERPFVTYKAAITLDGRVTVPGSRWVTGEESRRVVHELRGGSDAVAVGMGTVRADDPELTARGVDAARQPRRLAFGTGPLPEGSGLELRSGPPDEELRALASEGVQSLLLEGGMKLAASFLRADLVDKVMMFISPRVAGKGTTFTPPKWLRRLTIEQVGDDVLQTGYVHEP